MESLIYTFPLSENLSLRPLRVALGLSREELAVELGTTFYRISAWERGRHPIDKAARKHLERLLRQRGITSDKFLVDPLPSHSTKRPRQA
jgi:transcriptional regulator with XRE-family HTH domain